MDDEYRIWISEEKNQIDSLGLYSCRRRNKPKKRPKSADYFRNKGNTIYVSSNTDEDLHKSFGFYAKSIANAPAGSREMALAQGNLSAVLLRLGKHSDCLQAIDCCFNSDFPDESKFKIYLRKIECLKILNESLKAKEVYDQTLAWIETKSEQTELKKKLENCYKKQVKIQLPFTDEEIDEVWGEFSIKSFNEEIPGASDAIGLKYTESQGRHYIAERDIKPGEILLKDRPYGVICSPKSRFLCCWHCCKSLSNCIPCDSCEQVIFCSVKCKQEAWNEYHYMECKFTHFLFISGLKADLLLEMLVGGFRFLMLGIKEYGSFQEMKKAVMKMKKSTDPRTEGFVDGQLLVDKYEGFINLQRNPYSFIDNFIVFLTMFMIRLAKTTTLLGSQRHQKWNDLEGDEDFVFATSMVLQHMNIVSINRTNTEKSWSWTGYTGITCLSIPASFFNHSCVPNVFIVQTKNYSKVICHRPIKKGEKIFLDYIGTRTFGKVEPHFLNQSNVDCLEGIYHVNCSCKLLELFKRLGKPKKYTKMMEIVVAKTLVEYLAVYDVDLNHGQNIKRNNAMEIVKILGMAIEKLHKKVPVPCSEVLQLQMCLMEFCLKLHSAFT